jgi:2,3,4,5-tetrahydropyridine-2,6-dicarboxylate N-succinyltransferase
MSMFLTDPYEIAKYIKNATKQTPVKAYVNGDFKGLSSPGIKRFGTDTSVILFGQADAIEQWVNKNQSKITEIEIEFDRRNSAIPLLDTRFLDARIEPGALIRDHVTIGKSAIVMMGAVINIGAVVGDATMIDMNVVLGARATIGARCHIGAGAVIAGVLEPPSATPVIIEDDVLVGANAVVLEGVRVGKGAVVAAGAIVTKDVEPGTVVAGSPAKFIKFKDDKTAEKTKLLEDLRS